MKKISYIVLLAVLVLPGLSVFAQTGTFANIEFVENRGQWESRVLFRGKVGNGEVYLTKTGLTIVQHNTEDFVRLSDATHGTATHRHSHGGGNVPGNPPDLNAPFVVRSHSYNIVLEGATIDPAAISPEKMVEGIENFFLGSDSTKWASGCRVFNAVSIPEVYKNIDMRLYSDAGVLKYDFIVKPGGNITDITLRYDGVDGLSVKKKQLAVKTSVGEFKELYPYSYQADSAGRKVIDCQYQVIGKKVKYKVASYNKSRTLVIDPALIFSTYSGSRAENWGFTATYGPDGSFYGGGIVMGTGLPTTPGAYQTNYAGGDGSIPSDMCVVRLNSIGRERIFTTYIGGSNNDQPHSMVVDGVGNVVVAGRTASGASFPAPLSGTGGGWDIALFKLSADGTKRLGSKRIGGSGHDGANMSTATNRETKSIAPNYGDDGRSEVVLDPQGDVVVASCSMSGDFPVSTDAFRKTMAGEQDGVVIKLDPYLNTILFSTFLGGDQEDAAFVLAFSPETGNIFVGGATASAGIRGSIPATFGADLVGFVDGYIAEITPDGRQLLRFCYLGTSRRDIVYGVQFDKSGYPYVMGTTTGVWTVKNVAYSVPKGKQFISKLEKDLSGYVFSTTFGTAGTDISNPNLSPTAFLVDRCENLYVSGWGSSDLSNFKTVLAGTGGMVTTPDAIKTTTDGEDFYFIVLKKDASALLYATFYGQNGGFSDHVDGGTSRFDPSGTIYQAICGNCGRNDQGLPVFMGTPGSVSPRNANTTNGCNLMMLKIAFDYAGVGASPRAYINNILDTMGCVPLTVEFRDQFRNAKKYIYNFGDGSPEVTTTEFRITHTFTRTGLFRVRQVAIDSASCNVVDTAYVNILVRDDEAILDFSFMKVGACEELTYQFTNLSTPPPGKPFKNGSFNWDFGDGTIVPADPSGINTKTYLAPGTYKLRLILEDTSYCNYPDSKDSLVRLAVNVQARIKTPPSGCAPYQAVFENESIGGQKFLWDFGDGTTSTEVSPTHLYPNPGTYTIKLVAEDEFTCNKIHDTTFTIVVSPPPTAGFTFAPTAAVENTPVEFFNNSSADALLFKWEFGDGANVITNKRGTTIKHQYDRTGDFEAMLVAYNQYGCTDTARQLVPTIVLPLLDVPSAFAPQQGGKINTVFVVGFGIEKMRFRIYNRWGKLMFETNDKRIGWDGTFNGALQPMDVYSYTLEVVFTNGTKATKRGDITLLR